MIELLFAIAGVIMFLGFFGEVIFEKTNIPDVIWLMLFGIVIGRFVDVSSNAGFVQFAPLFTTFALIFILFEGAINIDIKKLMKGVVGGSSLSFINFILSMLAVSFIMVVLGWNFWEGILLGAMIGGASSAVIIPLTRRIKMKPETALALTLESAISDVLCIIGALTIMQIIELQAFDPVQVMQKLLYSFGIALMLGAIGGLIWVRWNKRLEKYSKSYMITIAFLLMLYSFVEYLESNGAIACLAFGIVVGNAKQIFSLFDREHEYKMTGSARFFFSQISFFVKTFFFVYLGIIITLTNIPLIGLGLLLTVLLLFIRPLVVRLSAQNPEGKDKIFAEILTPKGLAAAVLAQVPLQSEEFIAQYGITHAHAFSTIVLAVIFFSILLSTIGVFLTERGQFKGVSPLFSAPKRRISQLKDNL